MPDGRKLSEVKLFDLKKVQQDRIFLLLGGRNTGKSTLIRDLAFNLKHLYDFGFGLTGSTAARTNCQTFLPKRLVHQRYDVQVAKTFYDTCTKNTDENKIRHTLMVEDDLFDQPKYLHSDVQIALHVNGRHPKTSKMICCQYPMFIPTSLRGNIDYIFALREPDLNIQKKLHEYFFGCVGSFKEFQNILEKTTKNFGCLVLDKTCNTGDLNDYVKYYKAKPDIPKFRLGKPIFFWLSDKIEEEDRKNLLLKRLGNMKTITI